MDYYQRIRVMSEGHQEAAWPTGIKKGESFRLNGDEYVVTVSTPKTLRLKKNGGENFTFRVRGHHIHSSGKCAGLMRDIGGAITLDLLNEHNQLHEPSDIFNLTISAIKRANGSQGEN